MKYLLNSLLEYLPENRISIHEILGLLKNNYLEDDKDLLINPADWQFYEEKFNEKISEKFNHDKI